MTRTFILGSYVVGAVFVVAGVLGSFYLEDARIEGLLWLIAALATSVASLLLLVSTLRGGESSFVPAGLAVLSVTSLLSLVRHSLLIEGSGSSTAVESGLFILNLVALGLVGLGTLFGQWTRLLAIVTAVVFGVLGFASLFGAELTPWTNYAAVPWILFAVTLVSLVADLQRSPAVTGATGQSRG